MRILQWFRDRREAAQQPARLVLYAEVAAKLRHAVALGADPKSLLPAVDALLAAAPTEAERRRWRAWRAPLAVGRRIKLSSFPTELLVGDDLKVLERARELLEDPARFEAVLPRPPEQEG